MIAFGQTGVKHRHNRLGIFLYQELLYDKLRTRIDI